MKKALTKKVKHLFYYQDGIKFVDCISNLHGVCTGLYGDCTGLQGDIDKCELTKENHKYLIDINDLVKNENYLTDKGCEYA